jgi:hypothetical protein
LRAYKSARNFKNSILNYFVGFQSSETTFKVVMVYRYNRCYKSMVILGDMAMVKLSV